MNHLTDYKVSLKEANHNSITGRPNSGLAAQGIYVELPHATNLLQSSPTPPKIFGPHFTPTQLITTNYQIIEELPLYSFPANSVHVLAGY